MDITEICVPDALPLPGWISDGSLAHGPMGNGAHGNPPRTLLFGMLLAVDGAVVCPRGNELALDCSADSIRTG